MAFAQLKHQSSVEQWRNGGSHGNKKKKTKARSEQELHSTHAEGRNKREEAARRISRVGEGEGGGNYEEVGEVDDGPGHAGGAGGEGEDEEPTEEEDENVGGPHSRVHEPLGVPVQIRRRHRRHIQVRHRRLPRHDPRARARTRSPGINSTA